VSNSRAVARWLIGLIVAPAFLTLFGKLILPRWRMPIGGRAALFLIVTMALGPGLLANVILKEHWGRSRPIDVTQFSGTDRFSPWWSPRGDCPAQLFPRSSPASPSGAVLDAGAGGLGAASMAPLRLWRSACPWHRSGLSAHRQRRAFFFRRDVRRRFSVSEKFPIMGVIRPAARQAHRAAARAICERKQTTANDRTIARHVVVAVE
jgi:hypothetical protein